MSTHKRPPRHVDRRNFLKNALATGIGATLLPRVLKAAPGGAGAGNGATGANERVNIAFIGIGNRGADDIKEFAATNLINVVALCDTDIGAQHTQATLRAYPNAPQFQDFRQMFDKMSKEIDCVLIATPDFSHFPIAMLAMSLGKGVYVEKPMAHSFKQCELMMAAEKKYKVATQMGNQGHSDANYFQFKAWVDAGIIKNVTKITAFMNSSRRWHGMNVAGFLPEQPVPATLDWNTWLATANPHAYNRGYINGDWRSWFDFGNGALGDWGAHIFDTSHEFLELGLPSEVEAVKAEGHSDFIFPQATTLAFRFPARGTKPACELSWYDGVKNLPPLPAEFGGNIVDPNIPPPTAGTIDTRNLAPGKVIYGEGLTFKGGTHGSQLQIIPADKAREMQAKLPEVPRSPSNHWKNFLLAVKGQEKCRSRFEVAGPLSQVMVMGCIAQKLNAKLPFDIAKKEFPNHKLANDLLAGPTPRKEWEQFYKL